jgi:hypothetical protein
MIVFNVLINGEKRCSAGVNDGVVTANITSVSGPSHKNPDPPYSQEWLTLHVGGLDAGEDQTWIPSQALRIGDYITIEIVERSVADEPIDRSRPPAPDPKNPPKLRVVEPRDWDDSD